MSISKEQHENTYSSILKFYDFAEKLVSTVENEMVNDPAMQLDIIEPLVEQLEEATDVLSEEYRNFVRTGKEPGVFAKKRIEKAMGKIYASIQFCKNQKNPSIKIEGT